MKKKTVWGHCLVRNEERWVWYALSSVIGHLDKMLVWDTGSTDKTVEIIKTIKSPKISFRQYGPVTRETFTKARQGMLEATKADWIFLIDADEIWTGKAVKKVVETIDEKSDEIESIVVKTINLVGDVYHCQEEVAGRYEIAGRKGHLALRAMNMGIPGLHADLPHGQQGYFDGKGVPIQERDPQKILFLPVSYLHATHLPRSSKDAEVPLRAQKRKYELGVPLSKEVKYPEAFYFPRPKIVPSPWMKMSKKEYLLAALQAPFRRIKRRIFK